MEQNIFVFSEQFVYPNAEKLSILDISKYKDSNNLLLGIF